MPRALVIAGIAAPGDWVVVDFHIDDSAGVETGAHPVAGAPRLQQINVPT